MKKIIFITLIIFSLVHPVYAQSEAPYIIKSTRPISSTLRDQINVWLASDAPSTAIYYIVTNARSKDGNTIVSMVGVNLNSPSDPWSFEDGETIIWMGTIEVMPTGSVSIISQQSRTPKVLMLPMVAAGGGAYLVFPWKAGYSVLYGPKGVHAAGYGTSGMSAVDLVSGDNMGTTAAPPNVYAADSGVIDYVCNDGVSVAVRTYNSSTGDYFIYAHMLDNSSLVEDTNFSKGQLIGTLKYGSFDPPDPNCGYADQQANHYHLHWAFVPAGGKYQVGGCVLTISSQTWQCGSDTIKVGGYLTGGGGTGSSGTSGSGTGNANDVATGSAGTVVTDPTFWDYILVGFLSIVDSGIVKLLPTHQPFEYTYAMFNVVSLVFRLAWVFAASNINLEWLFRILILGITIRLFFGVIWLVAFIFKTWKSLVPIFGA